MSGETSAPVRKLSVFGWALIVLAVAAVAAGAFAFAEFADHNETASELVTLASAAAMVWAVIQLSYAAFMHFRNRA